MAPIKRVSAIHESGKTFLSSNRTKSFHDIEARLQRQCTVNDIPYLPPVRHETLLQTETRQNDLRAELGLKINAKLMVFHMFLQVHGSRQLMRIKEEKNSRTRSTVYDVPQRPNENESGARTKPMINVP